MNSPKNTARLAGILWFLTALTTGFFLINVRAELILFKDPAATARNIIASESLFRLGVASFFVGQIIFMVVAFAFYRLFRDVNRMQARLTLAFLMMGAAIGVVNTLNNYGALLILANTEYLSAFQQDQRIALMMILLRLNNTGLGINEIFMGLGFFTLGLLIIRSGFIPKVFGVLLILACFGFLFNSFTSMIAPHLHTSVHTSIAMSLSALGVLPLMFWLIIMGVKIQKQEVS